MRVLSPAASYVAAHPLAFLLRVLKGFKTSQGLLLAGAVAYYALLSVVPLLILVVIGLSHFIDPAGLFATLGRYLEWVVPGQSKAVIGELQNFVAHRDVIGLVLLGTMLFFSSLAFTVLEKAMTVIFLHRLKVRRRRFLVSALLPYAYILSLGLGFLLVTLMAGRLESFGQDRVRLFGHDWSLEGFSGVLLYLLGFVGEVFVLTSVYMVMPVGRLVWRHALIGGGTAAVLWEITRHLLVWYFSTLSQVSVVYGSLTTAIVVLFSMEIGATLLLLGAQVISEFERIERRETTQSPSTTPSRRGSAPPK
jgi:YihY family inner membrane protein